MVPSDKLNSWSNKSRKQILIDAYVLGNHSVNKDTALLQVNIPGIGDANTKALQELNIRTLGDLVDEYETRKTGIDAKRGKRYADYVGKFVGTYKQYGKLREVALSDQFVCGGNFGLDKYIV